MSRTKFFNRKTELPPYTRAVDSTIRQVPIAGQPWDIVMEDGPILTDGDLRPSYADHEHHAIRVNGRLPASERLWAACCAVALASQEAHSAAILDPLVQVGD